MDFIPSFLARRLWSSATVAPAAVPTKNVVPASDPAPEDPLPYVPSGHDHVNRWRPMARRQHRNLDTLVQLARDGLLSTEELCWIEAPGFPESRIYYTLRLLGCPRNIAFYLGKPDDDGVLIGAYPDHIVRHFYGDQKRMAGWCAIHLAGHEDMPLCQFHDQNTA